MGKKIEEYSPRELESKWIDKWEKEGTYRFIDNGNTKKLYILDMFPYPSGAGLHVGHLKGYLATDILTRFYTMKGYLVFHPMGWDAFGLPAEQYAIQTGNHPAEFTQKNISSFKEQIKKLMLTYDFNYEINTSDPEYYKHTQWIFSEMYERGLAKLVDTQVNWCPELNTVLSDEEIIEKDGKFLSERGEHSIENKVMKQWILKITNYAEQLDKDIDNLSWPDNVKKIQKDWIGKSERFEYPLKWKGKIYPLYLKYASSIRKLKGVGIHRFSQLSKDLNLTQENTGNKELLEGIKIINLVDYSEVNVYYLWNIDFRSDDFIPLFEGTEESFYDEELEKYFLSKERIPAKKQIYKLKDWVFSRQRFWGEPIPIVFDKNEVHRLDKKLPIVLPQNVNYKDNRQGKSPLFNDKEWMNVKLDNKEYIRETNTMPNWAGSSWYFIAYLLKKSDGTYHNLDSDEAKKILNRWLPVDIYVGGQEHAAMHLLYARFWHKFLKQIGIVQSSEPFKTLWNQGMVLGSDGTKMSKSKGNYVSIDEMIEKYGADSLRVYEAFSGPTQLSFKWEDSGIKGSHKWLHKVHIFFECFKEELQQVKEGDEGYSEICEIENNLIQNVEAAIPILKVNLGVSEMMIFLNNIQKIKKYTYKSLESFIKILSLYAPALAEEIWTKELNNEELLFKSNWPKLNEIVNNSVYEYKVFMNGKFKFMFPVNENDKESISYAKKEILNRLGVSKVKIEVNNEKKIMLINPDTTE